MPVNEVAAEHYEHRRDVADDVASEGQRLWREVDPADIAASWQESIARMTVALAGAQRVVASRADSYTDAALRELGVDAGPAGEVNPDALSGRASDGRSLTTLLQAPVITAKSGLAGGATVDRALASGMANLEMILRTQVADAGRAADGVAVASRPGVGYVRHLTPPSCGRCVVLAGRWYRYNAGFARHP